jgi:hypothetical protein
MMHDEAVANEVNPAVDVKVLLPGDGVIRVESRELFGGRTPRCADVLSSVCSWHRRSMA